MNQAAAALRYFDSLWIRCKTNYAANKQEIDVMQFQRTVVRGDHRGGWTQAFGGTASEREVWISRETQFLSTRLSSASPPGFHRDFWKICTVSIGHRVAPFA